jgi:DNA-binding NarL/FixJ family response regulator
VRAVVADDSVLLRDGIVRILISEGFEASGVGDAAELLRELERQPPDVCVVDIRMPPTYTDEGLAAARDIRTRWPSVGVLVLSQYVDVAYVHELLFDNATHVGYMLKDSFLETNEFVSAIRRVASGGLVVDSVLVQGLVSRPQNASPLERLSDRQKQVLQLMAEGKTDRAIADELFLSIKTVQTHVGTIFDKLNMPSNASLNRRVTAILEWLRQ